MTITKVRLERDSYRSWHRTCVLQMYGNKVKGVRVLEFDNFGRNELRARNHMMVFDFNAVRMKGNGEYSFIHLYLSLSIYPIIF